MSDPTWCIIRINASKSQPQDIWPVVEDGDVYAKIESLLSSSEASGGGISTSHPSSIMVDRATVSLWCVDGESRDLSIYADENGKSKGLSPNHRMNAMIDAGRFLSMDYDTIKPRSQNQRLKDSWGSNYFVGDVFCKVPVSGPLPDLSVFGENPIAFIMQERTASDQMKDEYGEVVARNMLDPRMRKPMPSFFSGNIQQLLSNLTWEHVGYHLYVDSYRDEAYTALLRSWGYDV
jgi:hypothetical protein